MSPPPVRSAELQKYDADLESFFIRCELRRVSGRTLCLSESAGSANPEQSTSSSLSDLPIVQHTAMRRSIRGIPSQGISTLCIVGIATELEYRYPSSVSRRPPLILPRTLTTVHLFPRDT